MVVGASGSASFAPSLTLVALALLGAHVVRLATERTDEVQSFAVVSNGAYLAASLLCPLDDGALVVMLIGAASLAFHAHRDRGAGTQQHTLDIALGWVLIAHLAFAPLLAGARVLAKAWGVTDESGWWWLRTAGRIAFYAALATAVSLMFSLFESIYDSEVLGNGQVIVYLVFGIPAALAVSVERAFVLTRPMPEDRAGVLHPYVEAALETLVVLLLVGAAVTANGQLIGRTLTGAEYDLFHGQWHFLSAVVATVVYRRTYDVNRVARGELQTCVCHSDVSELVLLGALAVHAILAIILKEAGGVGAGAVASEIVLGISATVLFAVSAWTWWRILSRRDERARAVAGPKLADSDAEAAVALTSGGVQTRAFRITLDGLVV